MVDIFLKLIITIILVSVLSTIAGSLSVFKKNTFMIVGVSHAALAGATLGIIIRIKYANFDPYFSTFLISLLISFAVTVLENRRIAGESSVGILFAASMSVAVLLLYMLREYPSKAWGYLVGDPYLLTMDDLMMIIIVLLIIAIIFAISYHRIIFTIFDYHGAMAYGIPVKLYNFIIYAIISTTVVALMSAVGILMVYTIIILPAAIAKRLSNSVLQTIIIAFIFSTISGIISIYLSYYFALSLAAIMGILLSATYLITFILRT